MALHRVFIPIVDADLSTGEGSALLWEAYCGPADAKDHESVDKHLEKNIVSTVAGLRPLGRYESGLRAYLAVRRLLATEQAVIDTTPQPARGLPGRIKRIFWNWRQASSLSRRKRLEFALDNRRLRSGSLACVGKITGNSSDLGLALCLLMDATQSRMKILAATGELAEESKEARDLSVKPVSGVQAKLRLLIEQKKSGQLADELKLVITPMQHILWIGEPACPVSELVKNLPEVGELRELGIRVCPVNSLAEAAREAGVDISIDKMSITGIVLRVLAVVALVFAAVLVYALSGKIELQWERAQAGLNPEPFLVCPAEILTNPPVTKGGSSTILTPGSGNNKPFYAAIPRNLQQIPEVPTGADLAWRVQVGQSDEALQWPYRLLHTVGYQGYHVALVMVGRQSGLGDNSLWVPRSTQGNDELRLNPGETWKHHWVLDQTEEENLLLLLARRSGAFDVGALRKGFNEQLKSQAEQRNFAAVEQYFLSQADGGLKFIFASRKEGVACGTYSNE